MKKQIAKALLVLAMQAPILATLACTKPNIINNKIATNHEKGILNLEVIVNKDNNNITLFHKNVEFIRNNNFVTILRSLTKEGLYFNIDEVGFIKGLDSRINNRTTSFYNNANNNKIYWMIYSKAHPQCKNATNKLCQVGAKDLILTQPQEWFTLKYIPWVE